MKKYRLLSLSYLILSLLLTSGCSNQKIRHDLKAFQKAEVSLSFELETVRQRNICRDTLKDGTVSMVMYYDSTECSQCRINHLADCLPLYELADSSGAFRMVTVFAPRQDETVFQL